MKDFFLGLDIGGTKIHGALVTKKGSVKEEIIIPVEIHKGKKEFLKNISKLIECLIKFKPKGIGIGVPNYDVRTGKITKCVNVPLDNFDLAKFIEKKFNIRPKIDNDANCFALGEAIFGVGKKYHNVVGVTLGCGFGSGVVIDKKIYHGKGKATELGHMTINYSGPKCNCGGVGCIEEYASAKLITREYGKNKNPLEVEKLALKGDKKAIKVYEDFGFYLGVSLVSIANALDPEVIIIGGNLSKGWKLFSKKMFQTFNERKFLDTKIVRSKLKNAGLLGAASLVF